MNSTENNSFEQKRAGQQKEIWKPAPDNGGPLRVRFQESNAKLVD